MIDQRYEALVPPITRRDVFRPAYVFSAWLNSLSWIAAVVVITIIFSTRPLGITWDDTNYITYFAINEKFQINAKFIEEPGWRAIAAALQSIFDPFTCVRVTIGLSVAMFFLSANKIVNKRWLLINRNSWFVLIGFLIIPSIAAHAYFGILRQGLAQSIFLFLVAIGVPFTISGLAAGSVHTGLLSSAVAGFATRWLGIRNWILFSLAGVMLLYAFGVAQNIFPSPLTHLDLGRRTYSYIHTRTLNYYGYLTIIFTYLPALMLLRREDSIWIRTAIIYFPMAVLLSVANPGFLRLFITLDVIMLMGIALALSKKRGQLAAVLFISVSIASGLWESRRNDARDTYIGQWSLILLHHS